MSSWKVRALVIAVLWLSAGTASRGTAQTRGATREVTIVGCAIDSVTRMPLEGLNISLFDADVRVEPDSAGFFRFRGTLPSAGTALTVFPNRFGSRQVVRQDIKVELGANTIVALNPLLVRSVAYGSDSLTRAKSELMTKDLIATAGARRANLEQDCRTAIRVALGEAPPPQADSLATPDASFYSLVGNLVKDSLTGGGRALRYVTADSMSRRILAAAGVAFEAPPAGRLDCPEYYVTAALGVTRDGGAWVLDLYKSCSYRGSGFAEGARWVIRRISGQWQVTHTLTHWIT